MFLRVGSANRQMIAARYPAYRKTFRTVRALSLALIFINEIFLF